MSLKLFRSTGFSSILPPGEARTALHPRWIVLVTSLWAGFVCNVALWRARWALPDGAGLVRALVLGTFIAAACGTVLSLLGWRKTLKPAATLVLLLAALSASAIWGKALPLDGGVADLRLASLMLPSWASLLRWQVSALLVVLAMAPMVWVWNTRVRRLPGPDQLASNLVGTLASGAVLAASGFLLFR
jgi:glucan phosphoethanolaminetransferase (alkaline phosphatase superfamily)